MEHHRRSELRMFKGYSFGEFRSSEGNAFLERCIGKGSGGGKFCIRERCPSAEMGTMKISGGDLFAFQQGKLGREYETPAIKKRGGTLFLILSFPRLPDFAKPIAKLNFKFFRFPHLFLLIFRVPMKHAHLAHPGLFEFGRVGAFITVGQAHMKNTLSRFFPHFPPPHQINESLPSYFPCPRLSSPGGVFLNLPPHPGTCAKLMLRPLPARGLSCQRAGCAPGSFIPHPPLSKGGWEGAGLEQGRGRGKGERRLSGALRDIAGQ